MVALNVILAFVHLNILTNYNKSLIKFSIIRYIDDDCIIFMYIENSVSSRQLYKYKKNMTNVYTN